MIQAVTHPSSCYPVFQKCLKVSYASSYKSTAWSCMRICVIADEQFGSLPKQSTLWQILSVVDDWERAIDARSIIHACFLDVAKAFDQVDQILLKNKLSTVGVQAKELLSWFVSYLSQRSICTSIDGSKSSFKPISSGVTKVPFWVLCFLFYISATYLVLSPPHPCPSVSTLVQFLLSLFAHFCGTLCRLLCGISPDVDFTRFRSALATYTGFPVTRHT